MKAQLLAHWKRLSARYNALVQREKMLVALAIALGPLLLVSTLFHDPVVAKSRRVQQAAKAAEMNRNELLNQLTSLQSVMQLSPDAALQAELTQIQTAGAASMTRLASLKNTLVSPAEMNAMLEQVLTRQPGLRLVGLRTLPPESLIERDSKASGIMPGTPAGGPAAFDLYRHGVEIRLEGGFADLYAYLAQLEQQGKRLLWGRLSFNVVEHPRAQMTLVIYTLSTEKTWLTL